MRVAVVGNGPSAKLHAAAVHAADLIVRCNVYEPRSRCDVWASHFDREVIAKARAVGINTDKARALWLAISPSADCALRPSEDMRANALALSGGRPVRQLRDTSWIELSAETGERRPSTGLCAVRMALDLCPDELILAGFDATEPGAAGWGSSVWDWDKEPGRTMNHGFTNEKLALERLARGERFCLAWWRIKVTWLRLGAA